MSHIFISYSRRDLNLAQKIVDALGQAQLETWIDWKSIPKGEDWEQEIYWAIEGADAFLFLISPDSIRSVMCNKEILHAVKNNKRILPILLRDVDTNDFLDATARAEINRLNWIFCRDRDDFTRAIQSAQETIRTDYEWLRFHTILQTKALEWERANKDGSRLLRGKELKETESQIAAAGTNTQPYLTDVQRQFLTESRRSLRRRRALPYNLFLALAAAIFLAGKFFYQVLPIARACPAVRQVSIRFEDSELPAAVQQRLLAATVQEPSRTRMRTCDSGLVEVLDATARYEPAADRIELYARLPETPAYKLDFLQEIRQLGPELLSEAEATALLEAAAAYSVGEYRTAIDLLEGYESLSALTLLAQARLFSDDLAGSRATYEQALHKLQSDEGYTGKLYMGAALAWWRPESYYLLSYQGNKDECLEAARYYAQAEEWIQSDKLARTIRIAYAQFCIDPNDPAFAEYVEWKNLPPESESDLGREDAAEINAIEQYMLARDQEINQGIRNEADRTLYKNRLSVAQPLLRARAALSEFYWEAEDNCRDARTWREDFRSGIISDIERSKLRNLLQAQPIFCR